MSLRKLHKGDFFQALIFIIALAYGIHSIEKGKLVKEEKVHKERVEEEIHRERVSSCQTMSSKYSGSYGGKYTIINGVLYCQHPNLKSYDKFPMTTEIINY